MYQKSNGDVDMVVARDIGTMIIYSKENEPIFYSKLDFYQITNIWNFISSAMFGIYIATKFLCNFVVLI